ncbi:MAG: YeeE/YedE family protein [Gammaproteobacteria bacterium]|nr:YeeE/YedE family protein [Gammaproteobacteria bacterium]
MHDYLLALIGGTMIGAAAVLLMASHGRIMGVSGIISRLMPPVANDWHWRIAFVIGVIVAPLIALLINGKLPSIQITHSPVVLAIGGLLVGTGTVIGNGCTSGHGVCGLSRFSVRSLVATMIFMLAAVITVYIVRH